MDYVYDTPAPPTLSVELRSGQVSLRCVPGLATTSVEVDDEDVTVRQDGDRIEILGPRHAGFVSARQSLTLRVVAPNLTRLSARLGGADLTVEGQIGDVRVDNGGGSLRLDHVSGTAAIRTGAGDVEIGTIEGTAEIKSGSGSLRVGALRTSATLVTGHGRIEVGHAFGPVDLKSGAGDLTVGEADGDAALNTASGDLALGRVSRGRASLRNVSGNIRVGVTAGTPVWTDISTATGRVRSTLAPTGAPTEGQEHVELTARSATGDIVVENL